MLSKSKEQILRIAVTMHVLFNWKDPQDIPDEISLSFVDAACLHTKMDIILLL